MQKIIDKGKISAPFNMAISTLQSVRNAIDLFASVSIGVDESGNLVKPALIQATQHKIAQSILVVASPLLEEIQNAKLKKEFEKIQLQTKRQGYRDKPSEWVSVFSPLVEKQLNELVILVQMEMQDQKYFMPPKNDPRFGWGQGD